MVGTSTRSSSRFTAMLMAFGQYLDHDIDHVPVMEGNSEEGIECCDGDFFKDNLTPEESLVCFPIRIPPNDQMFRNRKTCLNFVRSVGSIQLDCKPGPYQQVKQKFNSSTCIYFKIRKRQKDVRLIFLTNLFNVNR